MSESHDANGDPCHVRAALQRRMYGRQASLTEVEKTFLSALLVDKPSTVDGEAAHKRKIEMATVVLDDDVLFSLPFVEEDGQGSAGGDSRMEVQGGDIDADSSRPKIAIKPPKPRRTNRILLDLWRALNDGVSPRQLIEKHKSKAWESSSGGQISDMQSASEDGVQKRRIGSIDSDANRQSTADDIPQPTDKQSGDDDNDLKSLPSDQEVGSINANSTASSWNSSQGGFDHYDTWEVLRDEYASDFGFDVAVEDENKVLPYSESDDSCGRRGMFKILGTSADDASALPHVLSPPLMDSILNFVPEHLKDDNLWLKFSLVRDGASLDILKRYCRAATCTILAIETTNGEVFGAFTSAPWRQSNKYFGTGESFLWRLRHSRNTPVHCLFEQAQLESEIDIFPYNGSNDYIQLCTRDKIALGGGNTLQEQSVHETEALEAPAVLLEDSKYGFGLALDEHLLHGTTSPCATFGNGSLINNSASGETFDVVNLEVWGFTSAQTVLSAEKSEMSMFFVREPASSNLTQSSVRGMSSTGTSASSLLSGDDLSRDRFYRRVGENDHNEADRQAWQYANMMNPMAGSPYGKG